MLLGLLFYRAWPAALLCSSCWIGFLKPYRGYLAEKRRNKLLEGFRDTLYSLSSSFAAGYQMPRAIGRAAEEMKVSYGENSDIAQELCRIQTAYEQSHEDLAVLLTDLGERSCTEEIRQFAQIYVTCRSSGADIEQVCLKCSALLIDKIAFRSQVKTMISQKKTDILLLSLMPVGVLLFLNLTSYGYISVLYETLVGRVVMTCCLLAMVLALLWGIRICSIEM